MYKQHSGPRKPRPSSKSRKSEKRTNAKMSVAMHCNSHVFRWCSRHKAKQTCRNENKKYENTCLGNRALARTPKSNTKFEKLRKQIKYSNIALWKSKTHVTKSYPGQKVPSLLRRIIIEILFDSISDWTAPWTLSRHASNSFLQRKSYKMGKSQIAYYDGKYQSK